MRKTSLTLAVLLLTTLAPTSPVRAQYVLQDARDPRRYEPGFSGIPFVYYAQEFGLAGGLAGGGSGLLQPQTNYFGALLGGVQGSYGGLFGLTDLQLVPIDRLFMDFDVLDFHYHGIETYVSGNPRFPHEIAGTNGSSIDNHLTSISNDFAADLPLEYLLPIGGGRDTVINRYVLENGLLQAGSTGGDGWNPFRTGRTYVQFQPFCEYNKLKTDGVSQSFNCAGVRLGVQYDNTDFTVNPTRGNRTQFTANRSLGILGSGHPWTDYDAEFAEYIPMGRSDWFRQRVLALDASTSYVPTMHHTADGESPTGTPPYYEGSYFDGMTRMRGFDSFRFHDRASIYGSAELRLIPRWNLLGDLRILKSSDIAWTQWVLFVECGRVAGEYVPSTLFSQLKVDGGIGLRILAKDQLVRIDLGFSREGVYFWANLGQAF